MHTLQTSFVLVFLLSSPPDAEGRPVGPRPPGRLSSVFGRTEFLRASQQIYTLVPFALFLLRVWPCEENQWCG